MNDEISLGELIIDVLKFIKKYILLLSACFFIGGVFGYFSENRIPKTFTSNIVICSDIVRHERSEEIIMDLKSAVLQRNNQFLSDQLGISDEQASQIVNIEIDKSSNPNPYGTRARIIDNQFEECINAKFTLLNKSIFPFIESGILQIFSEHPVVTKILVAKRSTIENSRKLVIEDVEYLREQRKKFIENLQSNKNVTDADQFVTESNLIHAYDKITEYTELLDRLVPVYVMKSFSDVLPNSKSYVKKIILFGLIFSFGGVVFGIFREIKL